MDIINVRYFATVNLEDSIDLVEVTRDCFEQLVSENATISYERHTVFENGVNQICLTVDSIYDIADLDLVQH